MLTFEEACLIAHGVLEPTWDVGTLHIATEGLEDKRGYAVFSSNKEWMVDGDTEFMQVNAPVVLVDKETGEAQIENVMNVWDRTDHMTKVALGKFALEQFERDLQGL